MAKRYRETFQFFKTEEEARAFCDKQNAAATKYAREKHPAHYTEWRKPNAYGGERGFVVWYVY